MRKSNGWKPKKDKWNWRKFLTAEEVDIIKISDVALAALEKQRESYNKKHGAARQFIVNRAIHRAKYWAGKKALAL